MTVLTPVSPPLDDRARVASPPTAPMATVYEPTRTGMPKLRPYLADVARRRTFIWHLARTQLKAENYESVAGQVWILLNPLLMAFVYLGVRSIFRGPSEDRAAVMDHLVMGVFFFRFASASLSTGANSISGNRQMVLNTAFPRIIFPLAASVQAFMELLPTLVVFLGVHWFLDQPFSWDLVYLPYIVVLLVILNFGVSLLFAPLSVLYQDVKSTIPYISKVWLFATPVMYSVADVQANNPDLIRILRLNPLFPYFASLETIFDGQSPASGDLIVATLWSLAALVGGAVLFLRKERMFARVL